MQAGIEQNFTIHFASPLFTNLNENWTVLNSTQTIYILETELVVQIKLII